MEAIIINIEFGTRLKGCLKNAGFTQKSATDKLNLSKNAILNYTKGRVPTAQILHQLAQLCGVSMEYLLTGANSDFNDGQLKQLIAYYNKLNDQNKKIAVHEMKHMYELQEIKKDTCMGSDKTK